MKKTTTDEKTNRAVLFGCIVILFFCSILTASIWYLTQNWHETVTDNVIVTPIITTTPSQSLTAVSNALKYKNNTVSIFGISTKEDPFWDFTSETATFEEMLQDTLSGKAWIYDTTSDTYYYQAQEGLLKLNLVSDAEISALLKEKTLNTANVISKTICAQEQAQSPLKLTPLICLTTETNFSTSNEITSENYFKNCYYHFSPTANLLVQFVDPESNSNACTILNEQGINSLILKTN